jgi:N-acetylglucosamine kinase-like BadF-type ATPase
VSKSKIQNPKSKIFLGIDGGQSHTEAVVADQNGNILGRGFGGASNHAEQPGGRKRLHKAIHESVSQALQIADLPALSEIVFTSAHCGMTGGADYKEEIISAILKAEKLVVGHDAPTALFGATAGKPGVVVISGTGSIVYGINEMGESARIGGLGFLFSDEGSGFWLALQTIRLAIKEQDDLIPSAGLQKLVLDFFGREQLRNLTTDFYNEKISRDEIASLAKVAQQAAVDGNEIIRQQIKFGANILADSVKSASNRLNFTEKFPVAGAGGMFRGKLMTEYFKKCLAKKVAGAYFVEPRFNPAIGALLMTYHQADIEINESLLTNLEKISK